MFVLVYVSEREAEEGASQRFYGVFMSPDQAAAHIKKLYAATGDEDLVEDLTWQKVNKSAREHMPAFDGTPCDLAYQSKVRGSQYDGWALLSWDRVPVAAA